MKLSSITLAGVLMLSAVASAQKGLGGGTDSNPQNPLNWAITQSGSSTANGGYWSNPPSGPVWVPTGSPQAYSSGNAISTGALSYNGATVAEASTASDSFNTTFTLTWVGQGTAPANVTIKIDAYSDSVTPDDTWPLPPTSYSFDDGLGNLNGVNVNGEFGYRDTTFKTITVSGGAATYSISGSAKLSTSPVLNSKCRIESGASILVPPDYMTISSSADLSYSPGASFVPILNTGTSAYMEGDMALNVALDGVGSMIDVTGQPTTMVQLHGPDFMAGDVLNIGWSSSLSGGQQPLADSIQYFPDESHFSNSERDSLTANFPSTTEYNNFISIAGLLGQKPFGTLDVVANCPRSTIAGRVEYVLHLHAPMEDRLVLSTGTATIHSFPSISSQNGILQNDIAENDSSQSVTIGVQTTSSTSWTAGIQGSVNMATLWELPISLSISAQVTGSVGTGVSSSVTVPAGAADVFYMNVLGQAELDMWELYGPHGFLGTDQAPIVDSNTVSATPLWQLFDAPNYSLADHIAQATTWIDQQRGMGWVYSWVSG